LWLTLVRQDLAAPHWLTSDHNEFRYSQLRDPATTPTSAISPPPIQPETAIMSDNGEIEVESPATHTVLPKEVTDEIGSVKLFNKARQRETFAHIMC
jgi:hypothetical protein